eukprot:CAMPEP_0171900690 /NCGR_PEP_ID=MMETSP0992-20121227/49909_1 /TAXON_ID=483369 /ORGANISM="non described non described, Strain CCMP2098" /LENGTH=468 /DNA_ID=CAMNT_0012529113 /DNA_START=212 /DNA_END=1618 /DNA_ORIENTATION=+
MIAQVAPAVRVSLGEEFGLPAGTDCTGKLVGALRSLGFHFVFDVLVGADLTIMEEGNELLKRIKGFLAQDPDAAPLPLFTSCCPGWVNYVEASAPECMQHLSTCKSPHMMEGRGCAEDGVGGGPPTTSKRPVRGVHHAVVRKQGEADRMPFQTLSGARQVDHVLTTVELAHLIKASLGEASFLDLPNEAEFDAFMGVGTGGGKVAIARLSIYNKSLNIALFQGQIFGVTGGVMEAALRTVVKVAGPPGGGNSTVGLKKLEFTEVRGMEECKEHSAAAKQLRQKRLKQHQEAVPEVPWEWEWEWESEAELSKRFQEEFDQYRFAEMKDGTPPEPLYHFVEVMACPGGCIGGGGQPRAPSKERASVLEKRRQAVYGKDERCVVRRSHESPLVKELYEKWLGGGPGSPTAHELLHTSYVSGGPEEFDIAKEAEAPTIDDAKGLAKGLAEDAEQHGPIPKKPMEGTPSNGSS